MSMKRTPILLFFAALFLALFFLYSSSFSNPPRSDYWSVLYVFHQVQASPEPSNLMDIVNHDPWQDGTYRPLAHLLLYLEYRVFGADFIWNHIVNFVSYCLSILLLYLLVREFSFDRFLSAAFLTVYAFLFSHFDIITWTFQIFITIGLCSFLLSFILYLKFLKTGRNSILIPIGILFLFFLFCYEGYALWPLSILILRWGRRFFPPRSSRKKNVCTSELIMLGVVYSLYIGGLLLTSAPQENTGPLPSPTTNQIILSFCSPFFNLLYNGILINLIPFLTTPLFVTHNIEMGGLLAKWGLPALSLIVIWAGGAGMILLGIGAWFLWRQGKKMTLIILAFLFFLYFTNFFIISLGRVTTNSIYYPLAQFRYQYVPNALLVLLILTVIDRLFKPGRKGWAVIYFLLVPVLILNILLVYQNVGVIRRQLEPLRTLISNIRNGMERGVINERERVYLNDNVTDYFPSLCWNKAMAKYFEGTYQWMFSEEEIDYFVFSSQDACWIIDAELGERRDGSWKVWVGKRDLVESLPLNQPADSHPSVPPEQADGIITPDGNE